MPADGPTFPDMLSMVPCLLTVCVPLHDFGIRAVRVLRLVSKACNCIAVKEVRKCSVQLGTNARLTPRKVVRLMRSARLWNLKVTVTTTSGSLSPLLEQQLATCVFQLVELLQGMGTAISTVRNLTLIVKHVHLGHQTLASSTASLAGNPIMAPFAAITLTVFTILAAAVPRLQVLKLEGCCMDAALPVFGASCPNLSSLCVEAMSVPLIALQNVGHHLPSLTRFTLTSRQPDLDRAQLSEYVSKSIRALRASTSLQAINLCFDSEVEMDCIRGGWKVPPTVQEFRSNLEIHGIEDARTFLSGLTHLSLETYACLNILKILRHAPLVKRLVFPADGAICCRGATPDLSSLQRRMMEGLHVEGAKLHLIGSNDDVQAVLAMLPPLPDVPVLDLRLGNDPTLHCLADVARAFPKLTTLFLRISPSWIDTAVSGTEILAPLAACPALQRLEFGVKLNFTTLSLFELCRDMPGLKQLGYTTCEGVKLLELRTALKWLGREVKVGKVCFV